MNFAPKPQAEYYFDIKLKSSLMKDLPLGLGDPRFIKSPEMWNLAVITSKLPYLWEDPKVSKGSRPSAFATLKEVEADLEKEVEGTTIRKWVTMVSPMGFQNLMWEADLKHLSLTKFFGGDEVGLKLIIKARALTWMASIGNGLTPEEEAIVKMISNIER